MWKTSTIAQNEVFKPEATEQSPMCQNQSPGWKRDKSLNEIMRNNNSKLKTPSSIPFVAEKSRILNRRGKNTPSNKQSLDHYDRLCHFYGSQLMDPNWLLDGTYQLSHGRCSLFLTTLI